MLTIDLKLPFSTITISGEIWHHIHHVFLSNKNKVGLICGRLFFY